MKPSHDRASRAKIALVETKQNCLHDAQGIRRAHGDNAVRPFIDGELEWHETGTGVIRIRQNNPRLLSLSVTISSLTWTVEQRIQLRHHQLRIGIGQRKNLNAGNR